MRVDLKQSPQQVTISGTELRAHIWAMVQVRGVTDLQDNFELNLELGDAWTASLQQKEKTDEHVYVPGHSVGVSDSAGAGVLAVSDSGSAL